jgi:hypothetical protein
MKQLKNIYVISVAIVLLAGCHEDLMDTNPYGSVSSGTMWTSENLADQGVIGVYNVLRSSNVGLGLFVYDSYGVSSDERDEQTLTIGKATSGTGLFLDYWKQHYEGIHRANDAIKNLPEAPLTDTKKARLIAESKFLRAFFYYKLNIVYKGVPLYLEPVELNDLMKKRESETAIWEAILSDLNDCINEPNLPDRYVKGNANYGHITKAAAYALRGKAYLWLKEWDKAEADFKKVGEAGHSLFTGGYKQLFKEANEQCEEMIFSVPCTGLDDYGNEISFRYGSRVAFGSCWNTYLPSVDFVESYENADGSKFDWNDVIPGYNDAEPVARIAYFLRDNLTSAEKTTMEKAKADMSKYLENGNEERIKVAYENRDPRLQATIITPYSTYLGSVSNKDYTYTLRWPYRGADEAAPFDVRTDTNNRFHYLFRKFVAEGSSEIPNRSYSPIDFRLIRYAEEVLGLAEALNEQGKTDEAIVEINKVRARAGVAELNSANYKGVPVSGQADVRERIRNERRWEFAGEGVNFFDEMRWKTLKATKYDVKDAGLKQIWGEPQRRHSWLGDQLYAWPIPRTERQMNTDLEQNPGWND